MVLEELIADLNKLKTKVEKLRTWEAGGGGGGGIATPVSIANGGTGQTTVLAALTALGGLASVDGVYNAGGNIDLIAGLGITITPNDAANTITFGIPSGTSFPVGPATGDKFWRSDRNLEYYYDGTRWLTSVLYKSDMGFNAGATATYSAVTGSAGAGPTRVSFPDDTYSIYITKIVIPTYVLTTLNSTNYWDIKITAYVSGGTNSEIGSISTWATGRTNDVTYLNVLTVNAVYSTATALVFSQDIKTKVGAPGSGGVQLPTIWYRLVG